MQLFYNPDLTKESHQFIFDKDESRHIAKVLRKNINDELHITNGNGLLFTATILENHVKQCIVQVINVETKTKPIYNLHLAVAPTKMNDRYEWFLEKVTEIGVSEITPIICDHSERKLIKQERFERIIQSALKQSLQCYIPKLNHAVSFNDFIRQKHSNQLFIAHCEETKKQSLKQLIQPKKDVTILIGPEGDFSVKEIETAIKNNFIPVTLGETRLRTETAAIVACHSVAFVNE
ncbi:16S rRNA (uracil(1498)-N(3))-methyltransferase [Hanstruepera marina]|uniref:16S rRNA (uracil(1498)-N(3))-methyltransferase n=1 Tax=Hanstruepera marina TaxID=2873265 RepID=UPI001CA60BC4|nr:16S rRNA (uracil(1498)-N(3))-methyltransferase [Hanstruepera marina]